MNIRVLSKLIWNRKHFKLSYLADNSPQIIPSSGSKKGLGPTGWAGGLSAVRGIWSCLFCVYDKKNIGNITYEVMGWIRILTKRNYGCGDFVWL